VSFEVITNIKLFGLKDLVKFAYVSSSGDRKIFIFTPQVSTHAHVKFYLVKMVCLVVVLNKGHQLMDIDSLSYTEQTVYVYL